MSGKRSSISLATRIGLGVFALTFLLSGSGGVFYYYSTRDFVVRQMGGRLMDVGRTGAYLFDERDRAAIVRLSEEASLRSVPLSPSDLRMEDDEAMETLTEEAAQELMRSEDFLRLVQRLRQIKDGSRSGVSPLRQIPQLPEDARDPPLVRYAYLIVPIKESPDYSVTRFLADANFADADEDGDGVISDSEEGTPIGTIWPTPLDVFGDAFEGKAVAAREWYTDSWGTWLSAAIPIKAADGTVIAVMGLDYDIRGEANLLANFQRVAIGMVVVGVVFSLLLSFLIASRLRARLAPLTGGVEKMTARDFSVQIPVKSNDEIGALSEGFNSMVGEIRAYSESLEALNRAFERFVPREFLNEMGHETVLTVRLGDAVVRDMTVMFCDIRSFTSMSEQMTPEENFAFLNNYLRRMSPIIRENHGFIDKYIGDAVMALFPQSPADALSAAQQMLIELAIYNDERASRGEGALRVGIGLHYGQLMLGAVGEDERLESTVISDAVNIAARLEQLTKKLQTSVLASESTVRAARKVRSDFHTRYMGDIRLRGKSYSIDIYEVLDGLPGEERKEKTAVSEEFRKGLEALRAKDYGQAAELFRAIVERAPSDRSAAAILSRIESIIARG